MVIDIVMLLCLVGFGTLGFRDASARKLTAIAVSIAAMFLGHLFMHDLGKILIEQLQYQPATAPTSAFLIIFLVLFLLQAALYRLVTGNYKFGGIVDRIIGVPLGLLEGAIVISVFLFIINMQSPPSPRTVRESRLYKPVASIVPQIFDLYAAIAPVAKRSLESVTGPTGADSLARQSGEQMRPPGASKVDSVLNRTR